jgi:DNA-directed RNA polymerase II subunit RPB1
MNMCDRIVELYGPEWTLGAAMARAQLSPKRLLFRYKFDNKGLAYAEDVLTRTYHAGLASPSDMVGIVAAQSIAEPATQMVLNTFHHTGTGDGAVGGVPRIRELLNNTKNPKTPIMSIYLEDPLNKTAETAKIIRDKLHATYVKDLVQSVSLVYDAEDFTSESQEDARIVRLYEAFGVNTITPQEAPWMLRLQFDRLKMIESNATMMDVFRSIDRVTNVTVVASDDAASELIMRLRPPTSNGTDMVSELALFEDKILGIRVKGVTGTNSARIKEADGNAMTYNTVNGVFEKREEWSISAEGSNIETVFNIPGVDFKRTVTNNVMAVYDRLGIEAARNVLLTEFTILYSGPTYADYRHVSLLVDFMAQSGKVMPVSRHTMNSSDVGPLAKCSYEETVTNLASAGMYGEIDRIDGVSANIMLGQVVPCGTGDTILLLDNDQLEDIEGEVAKKIEVGVISLGADMILDLAMQFSPLLSSSQMRPWLNISMDSIVIQSIEKESSSKN